MAIGRPVLARNRSWPPSADSSLQIWSVRVSCHTIALWTGSPGGAVPDDRRLALVGDADGGDVVGELGSCRGPPSMTSCVRSQISMRVVLDPPGLRIDLLVLLLIDRDDLPAVVEDHEPGAGRSLVDRCCVLRHPLHLLIDRHSAGGPRLGGGLEQQIGRRRARVLVPGASLAEVARAALPGDERGRRFIPSSAASADLLSASSKEAPSASAAAKASLAGIRASTIVLSPGSAFPRICTPFDRRVERRGPVLRLELALAGGRDAHLEEQASRRAALRRLRPSRRASCRRS